MNFIHFLACSHIPQKNIQRFHQIFLLNLLQYFMKVVRCISRNILTVKMSNEANAASERVN